MKFHTKYLTFNTRRQRELVHLTPEVEQAVQDSGILEGMVLVSAMHITAAVFVNDNESGLHADYGKKAAGTTTERPISANTCRLFAWQFLGASAERLHERWLEELVPHEPISQYLHNHTGETNGDAHLKRQIMGREVVQNPTGKLWGSAKQKVDGANGSVNLLPSCR